MSEEDALNRIRYLLFIYKDDITNTYKSTGDVFDKDFMAIDKLYNMYLDEVYKSHKKERLIKALIKTIYKKFKPQLLLEYGFEDEDQFRDFFEKII